MINHKQLLLFLLSFLLTLNGLYSQEVCSHDTTRVSKLKTFYKQLDFEQYTKIIQEDQEDWWVWEIDTLLPINMSINPRHNTFRTEIETGERINFQEMTNIYLLSVSFDRMDNFHRGDDIYQHLILDSTRVVVIACIDKKQNIRFITDYYEIGDCFDLERYSNVLFHHRVRKDFLKLVALYHPEIILFCPDAKECLRLMFIKGNDIFTVSYDGIISELSDAVYHREYFAKDRYSLRLEVESKYKKSTGCSDTLCSCPCRVYNPYHPIARQDYDYLPARIKVGKTPRNMIRIIDPK